MSRAQDTPAAGRPPPGRPRSPEPPRPVEDPVVRELPAWECWARIAAGGVGRVAVTTSDGPQVLPVNYRSFEGSVVYRTAEGGALDGAGAPVVAFEVDHLGEPPGSGWSVHLLGTARPVTDPAAITRLRTHADPRPWVGGHRERWVRVVPHRISGREIRSDGPDRGHGWGGGRQSRITVLPAAASRVTRSACADPEH
ncbi:pyridoxamine 5'-phosphate oxidase family protein [Kitasatospora sp. NPDC059571]|uniref:pyridoxamine 5'-phosphate oxidase family protein n=1 Tax=Kitasatospora sp. NPDC059571 TaxID=3346871 RepID=UPI0036C341CF